MCEGQGSFSNLSSPIHDRSSISDTRLFFTQGHGVGEGVVPACSVQKLRGAFQISCLSLVEFKHKLSEVILQKPRFCDLESTSSGNSGLNTGVIWAEPKGDDGGVTVHDLLHGHNGSPNSIQLLSLLPPWPSPP